MDVQITLGNALEIASIIGMGLVLSWRMSRVVFTVETLQTSVNELKPHGANVPLLNQRVTQLEVELESVRKQKHDLANTVQWMVGRLEELAPREPSRPDLQVERDPRRR